MSFSLASACKATLRRIVQLFERIATLLYREFLFRNTVRPIQRIIKASEPEKQRQLLRDWSQMKETESNYIQLASGFLFTTVASCLQWPSTQSSHWSASALFYASILLAFVAIVLGSLQLLVLPNVKPDKRLDSELTDSEKQYLQAIVDRLRKTRRDHRPNRLQVLALQAPFMILSLAAVTFMAGLFAVVFAPLAKQLLWDDDAKVAVVFGAVTVLCVAVFFSTSYIMHGLFSLEDGPESRISMFLAERWA